MAASTADVSPYRCLHRTDTALHWLRSETADCMKGILFGGVQGRFCPHPPPLLLCDISHRHKLGQPLQEQIMMRKKQCCTSQRKRQLNHIYVPRETVYSLTVLSSQREQISFSHTLSPSLALSLSRSLFSP